MKACTSSRGPPAVPGLSMCHLIEVPRLTSFTGPSAVITCSRAGLSVSASTSLPLKAMRVKAYALDGSGEELFSQPYMLM